MIMKNQLLNLKMIALMCLMMVLGGVNVLAEEVTFGPEWNTLFGTSYDGKIEDLRANKLELNGVSDGVKIKVVNGSSTAGYIKSSDFRVYKNYKIVFTAPEGSNILSISSSVSTNDRPKKFPNGKVTADVGNLTINDGALNWTGSSNSVTFSISDTGSFNTIKITYTSTSNKTLTSLAISGAPTKTTYNVGEEFDPAGLVVTGTYDDNTTAPITEGITWTKNPETLSVENTSCSVTATVNGVTSPAYEVTGLTVEKSISLSINPTTSTVVKAPVKVTLTATDGATVYYTINGDEPSIKSEEYSAPFEVTKSGTTVKALAVAEGVANVTAEATYTILPEQPVFSDGSKTFKNAFDVTLSLPESTDATSKIHYAIGAKATAESPVYEKPINISAENDGDKVILHAVVVDKYGNVGKEKFCTYTKTNTIVFDFTSDWDGITATAAKNNSKDVGQVVSGKELNVEGVVMTATNKTSGNQTLYTGLYTASGSQKLRVYGSVTFTAPEGFNISEVEFTGNNKDFANFSTNEGNFNADARTWTGNAHAVTFAASKSVQVQTATIKLVAATPVTPEVTSGTINFIAKNTDGYYATFSSDKDVVFTEDVVVSGVSITGGKLSLIDLNSANYDVTDTKTGVVKNGYYVPAKTGVLVYCTDATAPYYFPKTAQDVTLSGNQLKPAPVSGGVFTEEAETGFKYYKLAYDNYDTKTGLGFYWGAPEGGKFFVKAGTAYLAVPETVAAGAKGFTFNGEATGIEGVNANVENAKAIYNLNGQRVATMAKPGLYIVNGKKVVRK